MDDDLLQEITGGYNVDNMSNSEGDSSSCSSYDSIENLDFLSDLSGISLHETVIFDEGNNREQIVVPFDVSVMGCNIVIQNNIIYVSIEDPSKIPDILEVLHCIHEEDPTKRFQVEYLFCAMCGISKHNHNGSRHGFQQAYENYRCRNCSGFFFEHDHIKKPCFHPHKYIGS